MLRNTLGFVFTLILAFVPHGAEAFVDPPTLSPSHPLAGDTISVNLYAGVCDAFTDDIDETDITQNGNAIRILIDGVHYTDPAICIYPPSTYVYPVGAFPPGSYTLQVDRRYQDIVGPVVIETLGIIPFDVGPVPPQGIALPSTSALGCAALALLLAILGGLCLRRSQLATFFLGAVLASVSFGAHAQQTGEQYLEVLVAVIPGAPSTADVLAAVNEGGAPLLSGLAVEDPQAARYLLPVRATGSLLSWIEAHPTSPRAKLERYIVIRYGATANLQRAISALRIDPFVEAAYEPLSVAFSSVDLVGFDIGSDGPTGGTGQYGRDDLNVDVAWLRAGGYALIGNVDSGLAIQHASLQQFSGSGQYVGGNFIPVASFDVGDLNGNYDDNVDEEQPVPISNPACDPDGDGFATPDFAGHGTHTSGLMAANGAAGMGVLGTCEHCGIAMWKVTYGFCIASSHLVSVAINSIAVPVAITFLADTGAQVVNMSFGVDEGAASYCPTHSKDPYCLALAHASSRDVVMVGASGNNRTHLQFPASDSQVIAAGGFESTLAIWDESPGSTTHCPYHNNAECGSNFTVASGDPKQELMASAQSVLSTTYPDYDWNPVLQCGDNFGMPSVAGIGWCTGTSMSAPQISGVVGILRSINPLVPTGRPDYQPLVPDGLRRVLASTTFEAQAGQPWNPIFGYGHPDASAAAARMLGTVAGAVVRNRVTPLFRLYSAGAQDYADVTSPQYAISLIINKADAYQPAGPLVPGYASFPGTSLPTPRAAVYVMTTEYRPRAIWPALRPLYLMDRDNAQGRDFLLITTSAEIVQAHNDGYNLRNIQGYVYQTCSPEPTCIPPGAQKFYRECNLSIGDCATFLESERSTFEGQGYTAAYPSGSSKLLGYAYPSVDSDGDGLIDGFEQVIGTNPDLADSDGDHSGDGNEFPMAALEVGDPCAGGSGALYCPANFIFQNGFD
ncbi:MAG: S8 family serine peptidase [Rhodanobacteraceae bacterium]